MRMALKMSHEISIARFIDREIFLKDGGTWWTLWSVLKLFKMMFHKKAFFCLHCCFCFLRPMFERKAQCDGNKYRAKAWYENTFLLLFRSSFSPFATHTATIYILLFFIALSELVARDAVVLFLVAKDSLEGFVFPPVCFHFQRVSHVSTRRFQSRVKTVQTYIFMLKSSQNFNFSQCSLAIRLMLERRYFLDGNFCFRYAVVSGSRMRERKEMLFRMLNKLSL